MGSARKQQPATNQVNLESSAAARPYHIGYHAAVTPDKPAFIIGETGSATTYAQLNDRSIKLANALLALGCKAADHIAILLDNEHCAEFIESISAAHRIGLYYTPINYHLTAAEIAYIIRNCDAKLVITSERQIETVREARPNCPDVSHWIGIVTSDDKFESYESLLVDASPLPPGAEREGTPMIYSSGSTGFPKGILRPYVDRPLGSTMLGMPPQYFKQWEVNRNTCALIPAPLYHSGGLSRLIYVLSTGGTAIVMKRFDAELALALIDRYSVTFGMFVPTMLRRFLDIPRAKRMGFDLSSMAAATVGAGACPADLKKEIIDWWGPILDEIYGGTEANGLTKITSLEAITHPGSVGRPVYGIIHIVDGLGAELPAGVEGTIYFEGGQPFEYHKDPEQTEAVRHSRGWTTLGDIGYVDDGGYLYLTDRSVDLIISGGVNIPSREVEESLFRHPSVADVAVIGVPNDEYGEEVKALIQLRDGWHESEELVSSLVRHVSSELARFKTPRSFEFRALDRDATGKLMKRRLRDQYWADKQRKI